MVEALSNSDTAFFIDHLLCFELGANPASCSRPSVLAKRAAYLAISESFDLLPGTATPLLFPGLPGLDGALPAWPPTGRRAKSELAAARRCFDRPGDRRWRGCDGEITAALIAPMWGQGYVRSSPLAIAHLYQRLVAAASGVTQVTKPHLLPERLVQVDVGFKPSHAQLVLEGMNRGAVKGTGRSACFSVWASDGCNALGLMMKTGTSLFPHAGLSVQRRAKHCRAAFEAENRHRVARTPMPAALARETVHCALYPMKWAVLVEPGVTGLLTVVLVERNSHAATGQLDAANDRGANAAAQVALLLHANRLTRSTPGTAKTDRGAQR